MTTAPSEKLFYSLLQRPATLDWLRALGDEVRISKRDTGDMATPAAQWRAQFLGKAFPHKLRGCEPTPGYQNAV